MKLWIDHTVWTSRRARRSMPAFTPEGIKSIAVIKHAALGDMLLTRPFLLTLKAYFPNAKLTISVVSHYQQGVPEDLVDRVHVVYGKDRKDTSIAARFQSFRALGRHDLIFDITSTARSFWVVLLNRAALKVGFIPRGAHKFSHWALYDVAMPRSEYKFEAETFLDQLNVLGLMPEWPLRFELPREAVTGQRRYITYFVGASHRFKCWPAEKFTALLGQTAAAFPDYNHIVLAGVQDWEQERARSVVKPLETHERVSLCINPQKTWPLVQGAALLVCNDTGVRNYAIAAGTPTVGIFFATLPFRYLPRFGSHRAAYELDGAAPEVETVFKQIKESLDR